MPKYVPQSVELIDHMGTDLTVVNSARVSYDKKSEVLDEKDQKLLGYLAKHGHWTPYAHAFLSFRIKAPIFVARQLVKHQVGLAWNEVSRRYVDSEPEFYVPKEWRGRPVNSKQGSDGVIDLGSGWIFPAETVSNSLNAYNELLARGVAPEQARMLLPLSTMTEWIWSGSVAAFSRVCRLRLDPHAQQETREIAEIISSQAQEKFPYSWKALLN